MSWFKKIINIPQFSFEIDQSLLELKVVWGQTVSIFLLRSIWLTKSTFHGFSREQNRIQALFSVEFNQNNSWFLAKKCKIFWISCAIDFFVILFNSKKSLNLCPRLKNNETVIIIYFGNVFGSIFRGSCHVKVFENLNSIW